MGKKPVGAGWLATVRKVFKPASKDQRHAKKQRGGEDDEASAVAGSGGEAAEVVSVEHFSAAETSPEVTNEGIGAVVWLEREDYGEVAGAARRERRRGAAASRVAKTMAARRKASAREERAAVRIQAYYRGYLARRALCALRALVRLQALVRGHQVRRQVHRTMRCMQALVRAQDRFRARRVVASSPYTGVQRSLLVSSKHEQHGGRRRSFGHDRDGYGDAELHRDHEMQGPGHAHAPPRRSNVSHCTLQEPSSWWDDNAVRADGMLLRHDMAADRAETITSPTHAYELQYQRRQTEELQERGNKRNAGSWHWMEGPHAGVQPRQQHAPEQTSHQHGAAETSYVTAAATASEDTVEMEEAAYARKKIPGYMAATQSARAKARMAPPPPAAAPRAHARARSRSAAPSGISTIMSAASLGWGESHNNGGGGTGVPESSGSGDQTPPTIGGRSRLAFA